MYSPSWDPYCPEGGNFYACGNGTQFVGCCDNVDPCVDLDGCSTENLRATSFDPSKYGTFADQDCSTGSFYTCATTTPDAFFGCCIINPCDNNGCPGEELTSASLSANVTKAADMDPYPPIVAMSTSMSSSTSTSSMVSSPTESSVSSETSAAPSATAGPAKESQSVPTSAIIGGALGGFALLCTVVAIVWLLRRHAANSNQQHNREFKASAGTSPTLGGDCIETVHDKPAANGIVSVTMPHQDTTSHIPTYQTHNSSSSRYLTSIASLESKQPQVYAQTDTTSEAKARHQYRAYSPFNNQSNEYSQHGVLQPRLLSPLSQISNPAQSGCWSDSSMVNASGKFIDSRYGSRGYARSHQGPPQELGGSIDGNVRNQSFASGLHHTRDGQSGSSGSSRVELAADVAADNST